METMETIKTWIKTLLNELPQTDKRRHLAVNLIIVIFLGGLVNPIIGVIVAVLLSIGKEVYDEYRPNGTGWDWNDLVADLIGILLGLFAIFVLL